MPDIIEKIPEKTEEKTDGNARGLRKRQICIFSIFVILLLTSVVSLNYFVNPYHVFRTNIGLIGTYDGTFDREILYPQIKLDKNKDFYGAICGSSSVMINISDETIKKYFPEKNVCKLSVPVISFSEQYDAISNFVKLNPEVKKIIVSVDFSEGTEPVDKNLLPKFSGANLNLQELYFLLLSGQTLHYSWGNVMLTYRELWYPSIMFDLKKNKFFGKFKPFRDYKQVRIDDHNRFPRARYTDWNEKKLKPSLFSVLKNIKDFCEKNGIEVVFYTTPAHAYTLYDIYYQGVYEDFQNFKREFVKIAPFYDFLYISDYSKEPVSVKNPYWIDASHADHVLGDEIVKKVVTGKGSYGRWITKDNVEKYLQQDKKDLLLYANQHKNDLKKFTSYEHMDLTTDNDIIYIYE